MLTFTNYSLTLLNSFKSRGLGCGGPAARVGHGNPACDLGGGVLRGSQVRKPGRLPRRRPQAERKKLGGCQLELEETALFNKHFTDAITFLLFDLEIAISPSKGGRKSLGEFPGPRSVGVTSLHGVESLGHRHGGSH